MPTAVAVGLIIAAAFIGRPEIVVLKYDETRPPTNPYETIQLFLASDLSRSVTGTTLHADGGTWAASGFLRWPGGHGWAPSPPGSLLPDDA